MAKELEMSALAARADVLRYLEEAQGREVARRVSW